MIDKDKLRKFGLVIGCIFTGFGFAPVFHNNNPNILLIDIALILFTAALIMPNLLLPLYTMWYSFGRVIGKINSFLILSIIFYLVFTPIGIIRRMFKKNTNKFMHKTAVNSYWIKKDSADTKESMQRTF